MTTPFIFMTLACVIMALVICLQWRRILKQQDIINDQNIIAIRQQCGFGKVYRRRYIFVNIENAGDNGTLNRLAESYYNNGFDLDREKSTDRLLVFVKCEEVKEG